MTDRRSAILEAIQSNDFHQSEMFIKSTLSRFAKDKRFTDIEKLLQDVLDALASKPSIDLREVKNVDEEWKHDNQPA